MFESYHRGLEPVTDLVDIAVSLRLNRTIEVLELL